jgi:hypothetical protein
LRYSAATSSAAGVLRSVSRHDGFNEAIIASFFSLVIPLSFRSLMRADTISIEEHHPLVKLGNTLPWASLTNLVLSDLKTTTAKGRWFTGRKLLVRVHLAAYILQKIYNLTDLLKNRTCNVDLKSIKEKARGYFFMSKSTKELESNR